MSEVETREDETREDMMDDSPDNGAASTDTFTLELPATLTIPVTRKRVKVGEVVLNLSSLAPHVLAYLMAYGARQCLNDAGAGGADMTDEAHMGLIHKRLDNLKAGNVGRRGRGPSADTSTLDGMALHLATLEVEKQAVKQARAAKVIGPKEGADKLPDNYKASVAALATQHAASPAFLALAQAEMDKRARKAALSTLPAFSV